MAITPQQLQDALRWAQKNPNAPSSVELRKRIEQGNYNSALSQLGVNTARFNVVTEPTTFEQEKPEGFIKKGINFAAGLIGGKETARGAGLALSGAPKILQGSIDQLTNQQTDILQALKDARVKGEDTERFERALAINQQELQNLGVSAESFAEEAPTNKQIIGSSARLAATLAAPSLAKGVTKGGAFTAQGGKLLSKIPGVSKASQASGGLSKLLGGKAVRTGASLGAIEGGVQGAGIGAEQDLDAKGIATSAATGTVLGGVAGGLLAGVISKITNKIRPPVSKKLDFITPRADELTPTEFEKFLAKGRIVPATANQPARFVLSEAEEQTAKKFAQIIKKDPVVTALNINNKIGELDTQVGQFLKKNNGIFNSGELKNRLAGALDDITDITIDEGRLNTQKERMISQFIEGLDKNDMFSLWKARKAFDQNIQNAFRGSPSVQKDIRIAFRNAIQDFISKGTPDGKHAQFMSDMSNLFTLRDTVTTRGAKQRALSKITKWIKDHPKTAKVVGWGVPLAVAERFFNPFD